MGAIPFGQTNKNTPSSLYLHTHKLDHGPVIEQVPGLIELYKDGHVERPRTVPEVPPKWSHERAAVASHDLVIDHSTGVWARLYAPGRQHRVSTCPPLIIYFHGGGFCVGSAAWACYHDFLSNLASQTECAVMSVNYRLAPEHRLPAAFEDGLAAVRWARQRASHGYDINRVYLSGDSAGASISYNVATQLGPTAYYIKGLVLVQPFFGGETRTVSEKNSVQSTKSALTLSTSDCYWRMALPRGSDRDHPFCDPMGKRAEKYLEELRLPPMLVCISELDILKDRNLEFCKAMKKSGKTVERVAYQGVGHAFQILHNYSMSQARTQELLSDIKAFVNKYR